MTEILVIQIWIHEICPNKQSIERQQEDTFFFNIILQDYFLYILECYSKSQDLRTLESVGRELNHVKKFGGIVDYVWGDYGFQAEGGGGSKLFEHIRGNVEFKDWR